jgi:hypothetical protein
MKRSHTIKIEDLQNSLSEVSIEEISQEQAKKVNGGSSNQQEEPPEREKCPPPPPLPHFFNEK